MATAYDQDEDKVACPVCYIAYRKPQSLKCGHILCTPCIETMFERNQDDVIQCTICRKISQRPDLRPDFTMQGIVDEFLEKANDVKQKTNKPNKNLICDVCEECTFEHKCKECDQFLCDNCKRSHLKVRTTNSHTVLDLDAVKAPIIEQMKQTVTEYRSMQTTILEATPAILRQKDSHDGHLKTKVKHVVSEIETFVEQIQKRGKTLIKELNTMVDSEMSNQNNRQTLLIELQQSTRTQIAFINEIITEGDTSVLLAPGFVQEVGQMLTDEKLKLDAALSKETGPAQFDLKLKTPYTTKELSEKLSIVKMPTAIHASCQPQTSQILQERAVSNSKTSSMATKGLMSLIGSTLKQQSCVDVRGSQICSIADQIWVYEKYTYANKLTHVIDRYDNCGKQITSLRINESGRDHTDYFVHDCVTTKSSVVVVRCFDGKNNRYDIIQINPENGSIIENITNFQCGHITCDNETLYISEADENGSNAVNVSAYTLYNGNWRQAKPIELQHTAAARFVVSNALFYSCIGSKCYVYNSNGELVREHKLPQSTAVYERLSTGKSSGWSIMDSDAHGSLLLRDDACSRLSVMDSTGHLHGILALPAGIQDAVMDRNGSLWITRFLDGCNSYKLLSYTA